MLHYSYAHFDRIADGSTPTVLGAERIRALAIDVSAGA
jgi:hypothetical protein